MGLNEFGAERIAARPLEFIWLLDVSLSMDGDKIQSLNYAIREAIPEMQRVASENVQAEVLVRAIAFSSGARWHISSRTPIDQFQWNDVQVESVTDMGEAFKLLQEAFKKENMPTRGLPPVVVLVTDGHPTDDAKSALNNLLKEPWGLKAVKIGIAIGDDADENIIKSFINNPEIQPLKADNSAQLTAYIKWASTQVLAAASDTQSQTDGNDNNANVFVPNAPAKSTIDDIGDVF